MRIIRRFTLEERQLIEKYIKENKSIREIAILLQRHNGSVKQEIDRCMSKDNYNAEKAHAQAITKKVPLGKGSRQFTEEEINFIKDKIALGYSTNWVGNRLNADRRTILRFLQKSGIEYFDKRLSGFKPSLLEFKERLENLEQQMEIVLDLITKEKKNG